jgi:nitroreductase
MDALDALHTRNSVAQLTDPAPSPEQLDNIFKAAVRANDHRRLRPWRFLLIEGEARNKLGQLMVDIKLADNPAMTAEEQDALRAKPLRAPTIVVVVATVRSNEKVPDIEQVISAGGAAQLMMAAAHAQDVGAVWRTGGIAYDTRMVEGLGLDKQDQIVGFIYLGTPKAVKKLAEMDVNDYLTNWGQ